MHMQGPTFRLPALMAAAFGAVGLYIAWSASTAGTSLTVGLAIVATAMLFLLVFVFTAGWNRKERERPVAKKIPVPRPEAKPEPVVPIPDLLDEPTAKPTPKAEKQMKRATGGINFEYPDELVQPARAPEQFSAPLEFQSVPRGTVITTDRTAAAAPRAYGQPIANREAPPTAELTQKYTGGAPMMRDILMRPTVEQIPEFQAELADPMQHPSMIPRTMVRGKCGQCDTLLLAPKQRPIKLRCPSCTRATLLEA